ncbi:hypothetical protein P5673_010886 [Acropora cervicornis]|uniref:Uncharacterized protein n=1 Tax=Acropora cervicornis TaxID=6130 RepID=A0AAD9QQX1_ACRCE|nr:hypothetical protein P5673_010886 [Acropora cervicornis]
MNFRKSETAEANRRCEQHHRIQTAIDQIPTIIGESKKLTHNRQKLTKIADRDEDGCAIRYANPCLHVNFSKCSNSRISITKQKLYFLAHPCSLLCLLTERKLAILIPSKSRKYLHR